MIRDLNDLMDGVMKINVERLANSLAHLSRTHRQALGTHEWFDLGEGAGFLKAFQKYALDQKNRLKPTDTDPQPR